jgi:hypothetical protein
VNDALPTTLRAAVTLLYAETVGMAVLAGWEIYDVFAKPARYPQWAVALGVILVLLTALFGFLAYRLAHGRGGGRNTAVALNLLALPVGYYMIRGGLPVVGILLWVLCGATIALLLSPPTNRALDLH